jgi:hypothetical protein
MPEDVQPAAPAAQPEPKPVAYVSMDPSPDLEAVFLKIIKPVLENHGLICRRNENRGGTGVVIPEALDYIDEADLVLCDLTRNTARCYYELGIAHAFRKSTLLISQETAEIPFDTRYQRALAYKDDRFGLLELRDTLSAILDTMYANDPSIAERYRLPPDVITMTQGELESARIALFHTNPDARRYALRFLGDSRDEASYDKVRWMITKGGEPPEVVREALTALHKIGPEKALDDELLPRLWGSAEFSVRERVVNLLANYAPTKDLVRRLIDQITDDSWGVRVAVCQTLGKWRAAEAASILQEKSRVDREQAVRVAAEEALRAILRAEGQVSRGAEAK